MTKKLLEGTEFENLALKTNRSRHNILGEVEDFKIQIGHKFQSENCFEKKYVPARGIRPLDWGIRAHLIFSNLT